MKQKLILSLLLTISPLLGKDWRPGTSHFGFPLIAKGQFPGDLSFETQLMLLNGGEATEKILLQFYKANGEPLILPLIQILNGEEFLLGNYDIFEFLMGQHSSVFFKIPKEGDPQIGWVSVHGTVTGVAGLLGVVSGLTGNVMYQLIQTSTGQVLSSVGVQAVVGHSQERIPVLYDENVNTGIAIANVSGFTISVRVFLVDNKGTNIDETTFPVRGLGNISRFVNELFPQLSLGFSGSLLVVRVNPQGQQLDSQSLRITALVQRGTLLTSLPFIAE
ncbi:hypothetical protein MYX65_03695 [Acidobacteria bacterium AH-259-L09]|nr:hypothetical protein [Acidobacteria bacterium AH-259-L09]